MPRNPPNLDTLRTALNPGLVTEFERKQYDRLRKEQLRRECEALRLYEPLPFQAEYHKSSVRKLIMQKGNQVGGTLCGAVEVARVLTGQDPYNKYPKRDGVVACLGYGESHIGTVFYPKLFRAGAFDIIRDLETGKWRVFKPWPAANGGDLERESEKRMAPPLIPQRFIEGKPSWVKRGDQIFSRVRFTTGWELRAYNSAGDSGQAQGFQCHLYWIDEDVATAGWVSEILFRLLRFRGLLRWTAVPHGENDEMMRLLEDGEKQSTSTNPTTKVIRVSTFDNKYLSQDSLDETVEAAKAQGDDIYRQRVLGELPLGSVRMYPTFNRRVHDVMASPTLAEDQETLRANNGNIPDDWDAMRIIAARMGEPPEDWTRYVSIDPGYTVMELAFLAVPPPHLGEQIFLYDESYIREPPVPVEAFAEAMEMKCRDHVFEAFIFDMHGGRLRGISSGEVPVEKYREALEAKQIRSERTGSGFRPGCDDRKLREEAMRTLLAVRRNGAPSFMVVVGKCASFATEMEMFKKKTVQQWGKLVSIDEGDRRVNTHAIEAVEQAIALDLPYVRPTKRHQKTGWLDHFLKWRDDRRTERRESQRGTGQHAISLGPVGVNQ
jgi:hypothetical protein